MTARASDRCLQCHETRGAIRREGLICAGVDYFGEVTWEADHHRFTHVVKVDNEKPGEGLWFAVCACGWRAADGGRFATKADAVGAGREHRREAAQAAA